MLNPGDQHPQAPPDHSDVGFIQSAIRDALAGIGADPETADNAATAIVFAASLHPALAVPLALDDLQAAIRSHDIPGIVLAAASIVPGARAARALRSSARKVASGSKRLVPVGTVHQPTPPKPKAKRITPVSDVKQQKHAIFDAHLSEANYLKIVRYKHYRRIFKAAHPEVNINNLVIHHALPKYAFVKYRGVIPISELHAPANLRGIPKDKHDLIHLKLIHNKMWSDFYRKHPTATTRQLRRQVKLVDRRFRRHYVP